MVESDVLEKVRQRIVSERLIQQNDNVVAAVSGGPDSVALLHVLKQLSGSIGFGLVVAHVNHGFRAEESRREAEGVASMAKRWNLPFASITLDLPAYIRASGKNAQDAAREQRLAFLRETAERYGAGKIALGHHADDQAETVLMRILRGTSVSGLEGIAMRRSEGTIDWIRPLLPFRKTELIAYCLQHRLPYFTDSSNEQRTYFRNQIRLDVLPFLERYNPEFSASLLRLAETAAAEGDFMERAAQDVFGQMVEQLDDQSSYRFSRQSFVPLHIALQRRLIKLILNYLSPTAPVHDFRTIEAVREAALREHPTTLRMDAGEGIRFVREYDRLILTKIHRNAQPYCHSVDSLPACVKLAAVGTEIDFTVISRNDCDARWMEGTGWADHVMLADLDRLQLPLVVRSRRPGDRIAISETSGTKKVKDVFIDLKIPPSERDTIPLVFDATGELIWIAGIRRSAKFRIHDHTNRILHMQYKDYIQ